MNEDLEGFKKILGRNFAYKAAMGGTRRCKWAKLFIEVKASFDEKGKLVTNENHQYHFLKQFLHYRFRLSLK